MFLDITILQRTVEDVITKAGSRVWKKYFSRGVASGLHHALAVSSFSLFLMCWEVMGSFYLNMKSSVCFVLKMFSSNYAMHTPSDQSHSKGKTKYEVILKTCQYFTWKKQSPYASYHNDMGITMANRPLTGRRLLPLKTYVLMNGKNPFIILFCGLSQVNSQWAFSLNYPWIKHLLKLLNSVQAYGLQ